MVECSTSCAGCAEKAFGQRSTDLKAGISYQLIYILDTTPGSVLGYFQDHPDPSLTSFSVHLGEADGHVLRGTIQTQKNGNPGAAINDEKQVAIFRLKLLDTKGQIASTTYIPMEGYGQCRFTINCPADILVDGHAVLQSTVFNTLE